MEDTNKLTDLAAGYRLVRILGTGGFAEVWEAVRPVEGARVALKFVRIDKQEKRTNAEFEIINYLKSIDHPHIIKIFDVRREYPTHDSDGWLIIEMELAQGSVWDRYLEAEKTGLPGVPHEELIHCLSGAAEAIDFLNERRHRINGEDPVSLIHGDVKPQNILLVKGVTKIADFGVSMLLMKTLGTGPYGIFPYCTPPEAYEGKTGPGYDQYSLAISYCKLLGGKWPFDGATNEGIARGHTVSEPDLSMIPRHDREIVKRALSKDPAKRWESCTRFVAELASSDSPRAPRTTRPHRENRSLIAGVTLSMLSLLLAFGWVVVGVYRSGQDELQKQAAAGKKERDSSVKILNGRLEKTDSGLRIANKELETLKAKFSNTESMRLAVSKENQSIKRKLRISKRDYLNNLMWSWITGLRLWLSQWQVRNLEMALNKDEVQFDNDRGTAKGLTDEIKSLNEKLKDSQARLIVLGKEKNQAQMDLRRAEQDREREKDSLSEAAKLLATSNGQLSELKRSYSMLALERGLLAFARDDNDLGLLWLARAYEKVPEDAKDMKREVLMNMASWYQHKTSLRTILPHRDRVSSSAFSPDGKLILTGCWDATAQLWDRATGLPSGAPLQHPCRVTAVAFCPDGKFVVTGGEDGLARLWDITRDDRVQPIRVFSHEKKIRLIATSPDGETLITASNDSARIWSIVTAKEIGRISEVVPAVVAFSPDGRRILSIGPGKIALISNAYGSHVHEAVEASRVVVAPELSNIRAATITPDGKTIAAVCSDKQTKITWVNASSLEVLNRKATLLELVDPAVSSIVFSPDGWGVALGTFDGKLRLLDLSRRKPEEVIVWHGGPVTSVAYSPDGSSLVTAGEDGAARLWDVAKADTRGVAVEEGPDIFLSLLKNRIALNGDAVMAGYIRELIGSVDTSIAKTKPIVIDRFIGRASYPGMWPWRPHGSVNGVSEPNLADLHTTIPSIDFGGVFLSLELQADMEEYFRRRLLTMRNIILKRVISNFANDGTIVVRVSPTQCRKANMFTQTISHIGFIHDKEIQTARISRDGRSIVTGGSDNAARIWDAATGGELHTLKHGGGVTCVDFSPNGGEVVTGCEDTQARIWDVRTRTVTHTLGHPNAVTAVLFSPDGRSLLTKCRDRAIRLWDSASGRIVESKLLPRGAEFRSVAFSPDGQSIVT